MRFLHCGAYPFFLHFFPPFFFPPDFLPSPFFFPPAFLASDFFLEPLDFLAELELPPFFLDFSTAPELPPPLGAGLGGGGGPSAGAIANARTAFPVPPAFVAVNATFDVPANPGVPLINPLVALIVKPDGNPVAP